MDESLVALRRREIISKFAQKENINSSLSIVRQEQLEDGTIIFSTQDDIYVLYRENSDNTVTVKFVQMNK